MLVCVSLGLLQKYCKELNILHQLTADLLDAFFPFVLENYQQNKLRFK